MKLRGFTLGRPQQVAALLLLLMFGECLWTIARQPLDANDYRFARCGREMWEQPSAIAGYFTTCGNLNGDGMFGYRLAGFPLTAERLVLLAADHFRKPENRLYASGSLNGTVWEARHELKLVKWLLRVPFALFAVWLGGGLWWVARRLFGNEGGALALGLYAFCPTVIRFATRPNNDILAMWGLYGLLYTYMGVAHALQGPRRKWKPRILLLTAALALTAAAHLLAGLVGLAAGVVLFLYLADRRRSLVSPILIYSTLGAVLVVFAFFGLRPQAFLYVFTGGAARFWFTLSGMKQIFGTPGNLGIAVAAAVAAVLYVSSRRSRYFGNTAPLVLFALIAVLYTTQVITAPWLWALPFLLTFLGGVFADALETRQRKLYLLLSGGLLLTQAMLCLGTLGGLVR